MLWKLQKKTLPYAQIAAYLFTLFIGSVVILAVAQFYADIKPLLSTESDIFRHNAVIVSKNVSIFKSMNKDRIYFTDDEIEKMKDQEFVRTAARFHSANFEIKAYIDVPGTGQTVSSDLFFESVPDEYLDIQPDDWHWNPETKFIPIIVPETYLSLYNFGFAESQGLPVISENMISSVGFNIILYGNFRQDTYKSRIVGLSGTINSILVPENFLLWANERYGSGETGRTTRILVEFTDPADERIPEYLSQQGYTVNEQEMQYGKMVFFFRSAMIFVAFIALIIILLSSGFILLSINLITQKNRELILNLHNIGYPPQRIARFYQITVSAITALAILGAILAGLTIRGAYLGQFRNMFEAAVAPNYILSGGTILLLILLIAYNFLLVRNIKKITHN